MKTISSTLAKADTKGNSAFKRDVFFPYASTKALQ